MASVKIINNTLNYQSGNYLYASGGIRVVGGHCLIENNQIKGPYSLWGIKSEGPSSNITGNKVNLLETDSVTTNNGIDIDEGENPSSSYYPSTINSNSIIGKVEFNSLLIRKNTGNYSISENIFTAATQNGINCNSINPANISNNTIKNFTGIGVRFVRGNFQSNIVSKASSETEVTAFVSAINKDVNDENIPRGNTFDTFVVDNIFSHSTNGVNSQIIKPAVSWLVERNLPDYKYTFSDTLDRLSKQVLSLSSSSTGNPYTNDDGNTVIYFKCDNSLSNSPGLLSADPDDGSQTAQQSTIIMTNATENSFQSNIFNENAKRFEFKNNSNCTGITNVIDLTYLNGPKENSRAIHRTGITIETTFKASLQMNGAPLIQVVKESEANLNRRFEILLGSNNDDDGNINKWLVTYKNLRGTNSAENAIETNNWSFERSFYCNLFEVNHFMLTVLPKYSNSIDAASSAEFKFYINGTLVNRVDAANGRYLFLNSENKSYELLPGGVEDSCWQGMTIYLGHGAGSETNRIAGGVSDIRISNTIRDEVYAKQAYSYAALTLGVQ